MSSTQPPYHDTIFGAPHQDPSSTTPTGTYLNSNTIDTGSGSGTGTTATSNSSTNHSLPHEQRQQHYNHHAEKKSTGPHRSSLLNKLDPRVDTHSTHQQTSTTPTPQTYGTMAGGYSHGSSTGAAGGAPGVSDSSSRYDPNMTGYNPSTGSGYNTAQASGGVGHKPTESSNVSSTGTHPTTTSTSQGAGSNMGKKGDDLGQGARNVYSGIHVSFHSLDNMGCGYETDHLRVLESLSVGR